MPDDPKRIAETVNALRDAHDYLFTTGGIGPTHDDITVDSIAAALGVPVIVHPEARRILEDYYRERGALTEARLRMARVPEGAELIPNPTSGAPGIKIGNIYILAGVPHIAASMLEALDGTLEGGRPMVSVTLGAFAAKATSPSAGQTEVGIKACRRQSRSSRKALRANRRRSDDEALASACARTSTEAADAGIEAVRGGI